MNEMNEMNETNEMNEMNETNEMTSEELILFQRSLWAQVEELENLSHDGIAGFIRELQSQMDNPLTTIESFRILRSVRDCLVFIHGV